MSALVFDNQKPIILHLDHEVRIELVGRSRQPEGVGMARDISDPEPYARQAVDSLGALDLFSVFRAVKGGNVIKETLSLCVNRSHQLLVC